MLRVIRWRLGGHVLSGASLRGSVAAATVGSAEASRTGFAPRPFTARVDRLFPSADLKQLLEVQLDESPVVVPEKANLIILPCLSEDERTPSRLADVALLNRIFSIALRFEANASAHVAESAHRSPLLIVIETDLPEEEAAMQQLVLSNAIGMHPVGQGGLFAQVTVWVMNRVETEQFQLCDYAKASASFELSPHGEPPADATAEAAEEQAADVPAPPSTSVTVAPPPPVTALPKEADPSPAMEIPSTTQAKPAASAEQAAPDVKTVKSQPREAVSPKSHKANVRPTVSRLQTATTKQNPAASAKNETTTAKTTSHHVSAKQPATTLPMSISDSHTRMQATSAIVGDNYMTEKELWRSNVEHPINVEALQTLVGAKVYHKLQLQTQKKSVDVHILVYRLGTSSSLFPTWRRATACVGEFYKQLTGSEVLEKIFSTMKWSANAIPSGPPKSRPLSKTSSTAKKSSSLKKDAKSKKGVQEMPEKRERAIFLLIHANNVVGEDAALFQAQLQAMYLELPAEAQTMFLGVEVLPASILAEWSLVHFLQRAALDSRGSVFMDTYGELSMQLNQLGAKESLSKSQCIPGNVVDQAIRLSTMVEDMMERREAVARRQFQDIVAAERKEHVRNGELSRAAQKVEFKSLMMEAVEEVSVRHEQATAHLVKTLSNVIGQWSLEKLIDGLEVLIKDRLQPLQEAIESTKEMLESGRGKTPATEALVTSINGNLEHIKSALQRMPLLSSEEEKGPSSISSRVQELVGAVSSLQASLSSTLEGLPSRESMQKGLDGVVERVVGGTTDLYARLDAATSSSVKENGESSLDAAGVSVVLQQLLSNHKEEVVRNVDERQSELKQHVLDAVERIQVSVNETLEKFASTQEAYTAATAETSAESAQSLKDTISETLREVVSDAMSEQGDTLSQRLGESLQQVVENATHSQLTGTGSVGSDLPNDFSLPSTGGGDSTVFPSVSVDHVVARVMQKIRAEETAKAAVVTAARRKELGRLVYLQRRKKQAFPGRSLGSDEVQGSRMDLPDAIKTAMSPLMADLGLHVETCVRSEVMRAIQDMQNR